MKERDPLVHSSRRSVCLSRFPTSDAKQINYIQIMDPYNWLRDNESANGEGITTNNEIMKQASSVNTMRLMSAGGNSAATAVSPTIPVTGHESSKEFYTAMLEQHKSQTGQTLAAPEKLCADLFVTRDGARSLPCSLAPGEYAADCRKWRERERHRVKPSHRGSIHVRGRARTQAPSSKFIR